MPDLSPLRGKWKGAEGRLAHHLWTCPKLSEFFVSHISAVVYLL